MDTQPKIFVVIPAYCEERLIQATITKVPTIVDTIIVVDDASPDQTSTQVNALCDPRSRLIRHQTNRGVGAAIYTGYQEALRLGADVMVVMAGDNQMDGADLMQVVNPVASAQVDYVKGNRHLHPRVKDMPFVRRLGSRLLARLTSWAMDTPIGDSQCGYTALSRRAAMSLDFARLWPRYGYPNDLLIALNARGFSVAEVPVRPVYATETSGLRPWHFLTIVTVIGRAYLRELRTVPLLQKAHSKEQLMGAATSVIASPRP